MTEITTKSLIQDAFKNDGRVLNALKRIQSSFISVMKEKLITKFESFMTLTEIDVDNDFQYVLFLSKMVKNSQFNLKLTKDDEKKEEKYILFIIFDVNTLDYKKNVILDSTDSIRKVIRIEGLYVLSRREFNGLPNIRNSSIKPIKLAQLTRLNNMNNEFHLMKQQKTTYHHPPTIEHIPLSDNDGSIVYSSSFSSSSSSSFSLSSSSSSSTVTLPLYEHLSLYNFLNESYLKKDEMGLLERTEDDYLDYIINVSEYILFTYITSHYPDTSKPLFIDFIESSLKKKNNFGLKNHQLTFDFWCQYIQFYLKYATEELNDVLSYSSTDLHFSNGIISASIEAFCQKIPLLENFIDFEAFQFHTKLGGVTTDDVDNLIKSFHNDTLYYHVTQFNAEVNHFTFQQGWHDYTLNSKEEKLVYWEKQPNSSIYRMRYEWLMMIKNTKHPFLYESINNNTRIPLIKGNIYIDESVMVKTILPFIYRLMMKDIMIFIIYNVIFRQMQQYIHSLLFMNTAHYFDQQIGSYLYESKLMLQSPITCFNDFYEFVRANDGEESPVIRKWMTLNLHYTLPSSLERKKKTSLYNNNDTRITFEKLPDIEDIRLTKKCCSGGDGGGGILRKNKKNDIERMIEKRKMYEEDDDILPPCMRKVMNSPGHFKNHDRMNMVNYFYFMGYSRESIKVILENKMAPLDIDVQFNHISTTKTPTFMDCQRIINLRAPEENQLRCIHEERHCSSSSTKVDRRPGKYGTPEKVDFIHGCFPLKKGANASEYLSKSPLHYIKMKFESL